MNKIFKKINDILANKTVSNCLIIICVMVFCFSSYFLISWMIDNARNDEIVKALDPVPTTDEDLGISGPADEPVDFYSLKFPSKNVSDLKKLNNDAVAWIQMRGTFVDYPVVQSTDNDYYLRRDFYKKSNSGGSIFADYRDEFNPIDLNSVIFGHMRADKKMFGSLTNCLEKSWYEDYNNHFVWLNTETENYIYQIFSVYTTQPEDNYIKKAFDSTEEYGEFLKTIKAKNKVPTLNGYTVASTDKILTLSTCFNGIKERLVVQAKLVRTESLLPQDSSASSITGSTSSSKLPDIAPSTSSTPAISLPSSSSKAPSSSSTTSTPSTSTPTTPPSSSVVPPPESSSSESSSSESSSSESSSSESSSSESSSSEPSSSESSSETSSSEPDPIVT